MTRISWPRKQPSEDPHIPPSEQASTKKQGFPEICNTDYGVAVLRRFRLPPGLPAARPFGASGRTPVTYRGLRPASRGFFLNTGPGGPADLSAAHQKARLACRLRAVACRGLSLILIPCLMSLPHASSQSKNLLLTLTLTLRIAARHAAPPPDDDDDDDDDDI